MEFSAQTRKQAIDQMKSEPLDLLIIGGGITGAGIALDASARGIKTGLIDMQDFAAGTSSRSTKLIHGGLRYLKQFEVEIVAEVSRERETIYRNAPHIVRPTPMMLPVYDELGASFDSFSSKVALKLYDELSEVKDDYLHYFIDREEALKREPSLAAENLEEAGIYLDYSSDDARLTIEILKKASEYGAYLANYVKMLAFRYDSAGKVVGVLAKDQASGEEFQIDAALTINATGPWAFEVQEAAEPDVENRMRPTKGIHLVVSKERLNVNGPIYTDTGFEDNRMIFIIPRKNKTYFGTTDTDYSGDLKKPRVEREDVTYLLKAVNIRFPDAHLTEADIEASWAGIRPLISEGNGKDPSAVSRGSSLIMSKSGLLTISGGKLTDYRRMAEGALAKITAELENRIGETYPAADTKSITLSGGDIPPGKDQEAYMESESEKGIKVGLTKEEARQIISWYGSNADIIFDMAESVHPMEGLALFDTLSLRYALEHEMTLTPTDYFARRTDYLLFDSNHLETIKEPVIANMALYYKWDDETEQVMKKELENLLAESKLKNLT